MGNLRRLSATAIIICISFSAAIAQKTITDPYEILNRYFQAAGGLDKLKAVRTEHIEGKLKIGGMEGTLKSWTARPDRDRTDIDLGIFKMVQADNGDYQWTMDSNGKVQKITNPDDATIKRKEVNRRMADYEYADRKSPVFKVEFAGMDTTDGKDCYSVKITNNINNDRTTYLIDANDFLLRKSINIEGNESNDTYFGDYREVDGIKVPFYLKSVAHQTGQAQEVYTDIYESNIEIDPTIFDPPAESKKDYSFTSGDKAENIKIRFEGNHLFIPLVLGCKERYWVLDTGAALSVITQEFADELGLEKQGEIKGLGAGGVVNIGLTSLPPFDLEGIHFEKQNVAMVDIKELNRLIDIPAAGILGYDFLSRFVTKIDIANETVSFYEPETFAYSGDGHQIDLHLRQNTFSVDATLDGSYSGSWLFDLGASSTSLHGAYALINGFAARKGVEGLGHGAAHAFNTKKIKCKTLEFAGFKVDNPIVTFSYGGTDSTFNDDNIGTLGNTLFRNFVIYCDYTHEKLIVEKGKNFNIPAPEDHSGLQLTRTDDGGISVLFAAPGTPASKAGFKEGDIIASINGIEIVRLDGLLAIRKLLMEKPGTEYKFVVAREGKEKKLKLKLAELL